MPMEYEEAMTPRKESEAVPDRQKCDECGTKIIDQCFKCGAPQCCPKCCAETPYPNTERSEAVPEEFATCHPATGQLILNGKPVSVIVGDIGLGEIRSAHRRGVKDAVERANARVEKLLTENEKLLADLRREQERAGKAEIALEHEVIKIAYESAHPEIEFVDGESGVERVVKFEYGDHETGIPDGWYVEDDYRPIRETLYWRMKQVIDALHLGRKSAIRQAADYKAKWERAISALTHIQGRDHPYTHWCDGCGLMDKVLSAAHQKSVERGEAKGEGKP